MSFASLLRHDLVIERQYAGDEAEEGYGHAERTYRTLAEVRGLVQPKSAREQINISQAGAALSDHTIFLKPTDITTADRIRHEPDDGRLYQVIGIHDAGGQGRHLELDVRLVQANVLPADTAAGS